MDCNHNKRSESNWQCRPHRPTPPGMNTDCCCGANMTLPMQPAHQNTINIDLNQSQTMRQDHMAGMVIGMGYVPWQRWRQTYPLAQAFQRGTIFPELDLPFVMGRCRG